MVNKNRKKWTFTYRLENWNHEFLYAIVFIIGQIEKLTTSSQEPLNQIQTNLAGSITGGWGFRFVKI